MASRLEIAVGQIEFARQYTLSLLEGLDETLWFRQPATGTTNIAWQVGHLAMAEYALCLIRIRGKEPDDEQFISSAFFKHFKKGSSPDPDPANNPSLEEIRQTFAGVHQRVLQEASRFTDEQLDVKLPEPHALFDTKLGSLFFCSAHEMLHAGQIGLTRRMLGMPPLR